MYTNFSNFQSKPGSKEISVWERQSKIESALLGSQTNTKIQDILRIQSCGVQN